MTFDLLDSMLVTADSSPALTPSTANQTLATIDVPEGRSYKYILVCCQIEIAKVSSPVVQEVNIEILNDSTVVKTFNWSAQTTSALGIDNLNITWPVAKNNAGTITIQLGNAGAADVDSSFVVKGIWAAGIA